MPSTPRRPTPGPPPVSVEDMRAHLVQVTSDFVQTVSVAELLPHIAKVKDVTSYAHCLSAIGERIGKDQNLRHRSSASEANRSWDFAITHSLPALRNEVREIKSQVLAPQTFLSSGGLGL